MITILSGIPCSGKSTYCEENESSHTKILSRDQLREEIFTNYVFSRKNENLITVEFDSRLYQHIKNGYSVILDNTHCKEEYIDRIIDIYKKDGIQIKFFKCSLLKAHYRNIIRRFTKGKWIPFEVINSMYKNFNKLNKEKYAEYIIR